MQCNFAPIADTDRPRIAGTALVLAKSRPQKNFSGDNSRPQKHECLFMRGSRINISLATIHDTRFFTMKSVRWAAGDNIVSIIYYISSNKLRKYDKS